MSFPSVSVRQKCQMLTNNGEGFTHTATDLFGLPEWEIASMFNGRGKEVRINVDNVSQGELEIIQIAAELTAVEVVLFTTETKPIFDSLIEELVQSPGIFYDYLELLLQAGRHHYLKEWTDFIVGHDGAKNATDWLRTHHWQNLGINDLADSSHLADPSRVMVTHIVYSAPAHLVETLASLLDKAEPHQHLDGFHRVHALVLAMLSNFLRGGVFYGLTAPDRVKSYFPRLLAALYLGLLPHQHS